MKIFFDTEFTGLHKNTTLISIGLVDENDRKFYYEFSDFDYSQCDTWIKKNILANLLGPAFRGNTYFIKNKLLEWLSKYDTIEFVSDCCHYDFVLLIDLLYGKALSIPSNVSPICHDINYDIAQFYNISQKDAFNISRETILKDHSIDISGNKHNSIYDAKVIKCIYEIIKGDN